MRILLFSVSGLLVLYVILLNGLSLHKVANRVTAKYALENSTIQDLNIGVGDRDDIEDLIRFSCDYTCKQLSFHRRNDLKNGKANCVGYAEYTSAVLNHVFRMKGLTIKSRPVVGSVHLYGVNLHPILMSILPKSQSSFFKDHDFVEIVFEDGSKRFIDTSLQDLTGKMISSEPKIKASAM